MNFNFLYYLITYIISRHNEHVLKENLQRRSDRFESETNNIFREKKVVFACEIYIFYIAYLWL